MTNRQHSHPFLEPRDEPEAPSPADLQAVLVAYRTVDDRLDQHVTRFETSEARLLRLEKTVYHSDSMPVDVRAPLGLRAKGPRRWVMAVLAMFLVILVAQILLTLVQS